MARGDAEELGRLMTEAQQAFDTYAGAACPSQLTAPVLHRVLAHPSLQPHILGGKGVGAGGDGTVQFLCRDEAGQREVARLLEDELGLPPLPLTVAASNPIRTAVVPAAGFATGSSHAPRPPRLISPRLHAAALTRAAAARPVPGYQGRPRGASPRGG